VTFAPPTLQAVAKLWTATGGVNLGIVGDTRHATGGVSYHLGKDQLRPDAYSIVQTARDRAGLSNAASAMDFGRLDGTLANLRAFSKALVAEARRNGPRTSDLREIIYSPDGKTVLRWDRQRGYNSLPRAGEADDSHLTHTHVSWYRDAEFRDHTAPIRAALVAMGAIATPPPGDDMPPLTSYIPGQVATIKPTANIRSGPHLNATVLRGLTVAEQWTVIGFCKGDVDPDGGSDQWLIRWGNGKYEYTAKSNVSAGPAAPPDTTPHTKAELDAAALAGKRAGYDLAKTGAVITHPAPTVTWPPRP